MTGDTFAPTASPSRAPTLGQVFVRSVTKITGNKSVTKAQYVHAMAAKLGIEQSRIKVEYKQTWQARLTTAGTVGAAVLTAADYVCDSKQCKYYAYLFRRTAAAAVGVTPDEIKNLTFTAAQSWGGKATQQLQSLN